MWICRLQIPALGECFWCLPLFALHHSKHTLLLRHPSMRMGKRKPPEKRKCLSDLDQAVCRRLLCPALWYKVGVISKWGHVWTEQFNRIPRYHGWSTQRLLGVSTFASNTEMIKTTTLHWVFFFFLILFQFVTACTTCFSLNWFKDTKIICSHCLYFSDKELPVRILKKEKSKVLIKSYDWCSTSVELLLDRMPIHICP